MISSPGFLFAAALLVGGALAVRAMSQAFHDHLVVALKLVDLRLSEHVMRCANFAY